MAMKSPPFFFRRVLVSSCWLLLSAGCATAPHSQTPTEETETQTLLSQAADRFNAPDAPRALTLRDEAQVEWRPDRSVKIAVHQLWATRVKPNHPLPSLASINQDSETLTLQNLTLYHLDSKGRFVKADNQPQIQWVPPQENLPLSLSKITSARLPELNAGQALDLKYTLETKVSSILLDKDIHKEALKPHPVPVEGSFAFRWNDYTPSLQRELTLKIPGNLELYGARLRLPKDLAVTQVKEGGKEKTLHFAMGPEEPVPSENFQPALQDLAPLTAFTLSKTWENAVMAYRKRVKALIESDLKPVDDLIADAEGNTTLPLAERLAAVKAALHQKVDWVDTGLPVYLNPDRPLAEIIESGKGTSHDMAVLLAAALRDMKLNPQIYLYRRADSGDLLPDLPALSQFDGVLVGVAAGKDFLWMDPTEPLAPPGSLPLQALDRQAMGVLAPLQWKTTPPFGAKDHRKERDVTMEFSADGDLECSVDLLAFGSAELALRQFFRATDDQKRRDLVLRGLSLRFPGVSLTEYRFGDYRDLSKPLDVHYTFRIPHYARFGKDGGFTFYPLVFEDLEDFFAALHDSRRTGVVVPQNFNSVTRVVVKLPDGYQPGGLPKDTSLSNGVAEFLATSKLSFGTLSYERYTGLKQRNIALGPEYQDLLAFYQAVLTQDRLPFSAVPAKKP